MMAGKALSESTSVDKIIFTGSDKVGKLIMKAASANLTPVVLELGGKDPFVVFKGVNLDRVLPIASRGVFQNCGQNCIGVERIFVEKTVEKEFIDRMVKIVRSMKQGVPLLDRDVDLGAVCMPHQLQLIDDLVQDAVAKGAVLHIGGKRNAQLKPGLFYEPTVLSGIQDHMRIANEEVFGPVCVIRAFETEAECIQLCNACPYGLGSSIFSPSYAQSLRITSALNCGMTNIGDFGVNYLVQSLPFGGTKASGFDRFGGPEGLRGCCNVKSVTEDAFFFAKTALPPPLAYPNSKNSPEIASNLLRFAYEETVMGKVVGLSKMLFGLMTATYR